MMVELMICTCQTSRFTYFLALNVLYNIVETLYTAYYAIGFTAYMFALISYLPFIASFVRMAWRDTETRRLIFYRNCINLWLMTAMIDLWIVCNLFTQIDELCEIAKFSHRLTFTQLADFFDVKSVSRNSVIQLCTTRL